MAESIKKEAVTKKKNRKLFKIIIPLLLVLIIAGALVVIIMYNLFSLRDKTFDVIYSLDPEFQAIETIKAELDTKEAGLIKREEQAVKNEDRLVKLEAELEQKQQELDAQELESTPIYLRPLTDGELDNMKSISKVYSEMGPVDAGELLASLYSIDDMAAILFYMPEESAAAILAVMDRATAVEVTDSLLHY